MNYDEKSCGIIIFRAENGRRLYLVLHYPGGHWDFAKGHVEEIDSSEQATALRELAEETGLKNIKLIDGYREQISYEYETMEGKSSNKEVIFFLGEAKDSEIVISHEHIDFEWLPYDEALRKVTFDNSKRILRIAEAKLNES